LYESGGTAVAVTDDQILAAQAQLGRSEGIFAAPEGAATVAALPELLHQGWLKPDDRVVLLNTGTGLKYLS
jgi:threonine synthase